MAEGSGTTSNVVGLSADIVAAYVTKNHIQKDELPALIATGQRAQLLAGRTVAIAEFTNRYYRGVAAPLSDNITT
jgi:predicted transcriptional regulator